MITLQPPPERDLPPRRDAEIRAALRRVTDPARPRRVRWLVVVAVAVVLAVVAVGVPRLRTAPPTAEPAAPPSSGTGPGPSATPSPTPTARPIDLGPVADRATAVRDCAVYDDSGSPVATVLFARRTTAGTALLLRNRAGLTYSCAPSGGGHVAGPGSKTRPLPELGPRRPAVRLTGLGFTSGGAGAEETVTGSLFYAVTPDVATIELRVVTATATGPWFAASVHDGWAYGAATVVARPPSAGPRSMRTDLRLQDRAYDRDGRELPIDRTPR